MNFVGTKLKIIFIYSYLTKIMGEKKGYNIVLFYFWNYVLSSGDKENFNLLYFFFEQIFFPFLIMFFI